MPKSNDKTPISADQAKQAATETFDKLKSHFDKKKVDKWQEKWLAMPENRKKYENISDAPEVVGEEMVAIVNDIIDFAQGEEAGKSHVFGKLKGSIGGLFGKAKGMAEAGADKAKSAAEGAAKEAKAQAGKAAKEAKNKAEGAAKSAAKGATAKAKKTASKASKSVKK